MNTINTVVPHCQIHHYHFPLAGRSKGYTGNKRLHSLELKTTFKEGKSMKFFWIKLISCNTVLTHSFNWNYRQQLNKKLAKLNDNSLFNFLKV